MSYFPHRNPLFLSTFNNYIPNSLVKLSKLSVQLCVPIMPTVRRLRQDVLDFRTSMDYIETLFYTNNKNTHENIACIEFS